ncbi:MAG: VCBS repeat-containing protein [Bacteroidales bacterium]|nr:VCBS repeat-containing protein [Bacteroidales bacterium]
MKNEAQFFLILIISAALLNKLNVNAQFPEFTFHTIGHTEQMMLGQSSLADLDNDADLDLIVGASGSTIWWYEYKSADNWKMHIIGDDAYTDKGGVAFDVNGDGHIDQVSGGTWYKNPGNKTDSWERFENGVIFSYDNIIADVNSDGKPELFAMSPQDGLFVYFIGDKPEKSWKKVRIGDGVPGGIFPNGAGDIDSDGDVDLVRSDVWYDNIKGDGTKWLVHRTIRYVESTGEFARSSRVHLADMDGDGDIDVIQSTSNSASGNMAWHENKDGKGINWYTHHIATETEQDLHSLCIADFDNDGDLDIFSGAGTMTGELYKRGFIWENVEGKGEKWEKHEILFKKECVDAVAGDIDGDGDIDICSKTWKDDEVYYLQNMLMENK